MDIIFAGRKAGRSLPAPAGEGDAIEIFWDNWDDFSFKTYFPTSARINGLPVELGPVRILVRGSDTTHQFLSALRDGGWDGRFPLPEGDYISVPEEITFYQQLEGLVGIEGAVEVARKLRDASYLTRFQADKAAEALTDTDGFRDALLRERGSVKAYTDGWQIFALKAASVRDIGFSFEDVFGDVSTIDFPFETDGPFPHDINVLIGPNGVGKSQLLHQIVDSWIEPNHAEEQELGFRTPPNVSQLVVVSYSPFERFRLDVAGEDLVDKSIYRYFGLRGRVDPPTEDGPNIVLSHDYPKSDAAKSLLDCVSDDLRYRSIKTWPFKVATLEAVLRKAIRFDKVGLKVSAEGDPKRFAEFGDLSEITVYEFDGEAARERYVAIGPGDIDDLDLKVLRAECELLAGVYFFKDGLRVALSSGQRLFAYIVINVLGAIRRNSLILIDEPELFLHPTLEIQFVDMLKMILSSLGSKAILATHSVVTVREMPSDCVHVFARTQDELVIKTPPFQTFGGDIQRISSYVFGDRESVKPYVSWIREQLEKYKSPDALIEALGDELNEELIIQIKAMGRGQW